MACCGRRVVHPADFTFKLPDHVSYAEGAMVEPLAVGVHAATKVQVQPGDLAVVIGAGPDRHGDDSGGPRRRLLTGHRQRRP